MKDCQGRNQTTAVKLEGTRGGTWGGANPRQPTRWSGGASINGFG